MRIRGFLLVALVTAFAFVARAEDDPKGEEAKSGQAKAASDSRKRDEAVLAGMTKFVGDTRIDEKGVKSVLAHWKSFEALGGDKPEEDVIRKAIDETYEKTGAFDFSVVLRHPEIKKWAAKAGVDPSKWVKQYMRASMILMRRDLLANTERIRVQVKRELAENERERAHLKEGEYQRFKAAMERNLKATEAMAKAAKKIPEPSASEQELMRTYGKKLRAVMGDDEDETDDGIGRGDDDGRDGRRDDDEDEDGGDHGGDG